MKGSTLTRNVLNTLEDCVQLSCKLITDSETGISHEDCGQQALRNTHRCQRTRGSHPVRLHVESRHLAFASVVSALGKITVAGPVEEMHTKLSPVHGTTPERGSPAKTFTATSGSCVGSDAHHLTTLPEGNCNISKRFVIPFVVDVVDRMALLDIQPPGDVNTLTGTAVSSTGKTTAASPSEETHVNILLCLATTGSSAEL